MKRLVLSAIIFAVPAAIATDLQAGKSKVANLCGACHGANGVSVADNIPNLAAQRAGYILQQLKALKSGERKSEVMNAIAAPLSDDEMQNVAAYFASLPGAPASAR